MFNNSLHFISVKTIEINNSADSDPDKDKTSFQFIIKAKKSKAKKQEKLTISGGLKVGQTYDVTKAVKDSQGSTSYTKCGIFSVKNTPLLWSTSI